MRDESNQKTVPIFQMFLILLRSTVLKVHHNVKRTSFHFNTGAPKVYETVALSSDCQDTFSFHIYWANQAKLRTCAPGMRQYYKV